MRDRESDESVEELAKDAAMAEQDLQEAVDEKDSAPATKPPHRAV